MKTENLSTLIIHLFKTKNQYNRAREIGQVSDTDLCLLPYNEDEILPIEKGGTGNNVGYIQTGQKAEETIGIRATAEGYENIASGEGSHTEGYGNTASKICSHAEGAGTQAIGDRSHTEGINTTASGENSHAEGSSTTASNGNAHAEGSSTTASGANSHAEGIHTNAQGDHSHAEGDTTQAIGNNSHTEGSDTIASEANAHAEGYDTTASGTNSHAEGEWSEASGIASHAEGSDTTASGDYSHAEGCSSEATGAYSHAEGYYTNSSEYTSHTEGCATRAIAKYSHAEGYYTHANTEGSHVQGKCNIIDNAKIYAHIVGNGSCTHVEPVQEYVDMVRSNCHTLDWNGNATFAGSVTGAGADYAEYFEWLDGNPNIEDRIGLIVTLEGDKIRLANPEDDILGIVSATAMVIGDNAEWEWKDKYLFDDYGRVITEMVEQFEIVKNPETEETEKVSIGFAPRRKLNPNYDPEQVYIRRSERPEWATIGLIGKLHVTDDGTCVVGGYATVGNNSVATKSDQKTGMRVMKRISDTVILVFMK